MFPCAVFLVVADESVGRTVPFVFLERVQDDFKQRYGASIRNEGPHPLADDDDELFEDQFGIAYNLDREFEPRLKEHMQYCLNHLEEISSGHGEKTQLLVDKTENLQFQVGAIFSLIEQIWKGFKCKLIIYIWFVLMLVLYIGDRKSVV